MSVAFIELATNVNDWWKLPLALRQRWWTETDYGRLDPSDDLKAAVQAALNRGVTTMSDDPKDPPKPPSEPEKPVEPPPSEDKPAVDEPPKEDAA